jgi:hypothetical protein
LDGLLLAVLGLLPGMVAWQTVWSWIRREGAAADCTYCWCPQDRVEAGANRPLHYTYSSEKEVFTALQIEKPSMDSPSDTVTR